MTAATMGDDGTKCTADGHSLDSPQLPCLSQPLVACAPGRYPSYSPARQWVIRVQRPTVAAPGDRTGWCVEPAPLRPDPFPQPQENDNLGSGRSASAARTPAACRGGQLWLAFLSVAPSSYHPGAPPGCFPTNIGRNPEVRVQTNVW